MYVKVVLLAVIGILTLSACYALEPRAPERSFTPEDLLIGQSVLPPAWKASEPFRPMGEGLPTKESVAVRYGVSGETGLALAAQFVYRYSSSGIAQRTFDNVFLAENRSLEPVSEWTYQSPIAEQSYFGCGAMAGGVDQICVWGGRYEEFIVEFQARLIPEEMPLATMEQVIRAIDSKMADHLEKSLPSESPTP